MSGCMQRTSSKSACCKLCATSLCCVVLCCIAYFFQKKKLSLSATKQLTKHTLCTTGTLFVYFVQSNEGNRFHEMCAYIEL